MLSLLECITGFSLSSLEDVKLIYNVNLIFHVSDFFKDYLRHILSII